MNKCPDCGKEFVRFPLRDSNGKPIIRNWFKMDMVHFLFFLSIIIILFGFYKYNEQVKDVIANPCEYAKQVGCNVLTIEREEIDPMQPLPPNYSFPEVS